MIEIEYVDGLCAIECKNMRSIEWADECVNECQYVCLLIIEELYIKYDRGVCFLLQSLEHKEKQCNSAGMNGDVSIKGCKNIFKKTNKSFVKHDVDVLLFTFVEKEKKTKQKL